MYRLITILLLCLFGCNAITEKSTVLNCAYPDGFNEYILRCFTLVPEIKDKYIYTVPIDAYNPTTPNRCFLWGVDYNSSVFEWPKPVPTQFYTGVTSTGPFINWSWH
jgi:hypothetical protein